MILKSHPNKCLIDHLRTVGINSKNLIISKILNLPKEIDESIIADIISLIGFTHDFGKATLYFQKRLENKTKSSKFSNHAYLSAIFTYFVVKKYLSDKFLLEKEYYKYLPIISFFIVKRHHGNLKNADGEVILDEERDEILEKQIESIDFDLIDEIYKDLFSNIEDFEFDCPKYKKEMLEFDEKIVYGRKKQNKKYINSFKKDNKLIRNLDEKHSLFFYFTIILFYSILLDADKTDASDLKSIERNKIDENLVDIYKIKKFSDKVDKINTIREEIYQEVLSKVQSLNLDDEKILSLNVPTGTGKTLTAFSFALKLRARIECERNYTPRIIYSLPFLSIIDQNFDVFEDVFEEVLGNKPASDMLLKHHHLSDVVYSQSESLEDEFEYENKNDKSHDLLLIEGWNSEIIVTTFIQFFYTIISKKNRSIRKFHRIVNSIIILDEVQTIPHKYWLLLNKMMKYMADNFNVHFIFITATLPLIFDEQKKEIIPLIDNKKKYFDALDRIKMSMNLTVIDIDEFKNILLKDINENLNLDFLIVLNTIKSANDVYDFIKEHLKNNEIFYLSTHIIPKSRLSRIKEMKEIKKDSKMRKIIVSTQLIEAGVDIDVDVVYRDFAPLDSINQVAGRCNRNNTYKDKKGLVKIFILKSVDSDREYHSYIYEKFVIDKTKDTIKENSLTPSELEIQEIEESKFLLLNEEYFKKVELGKSDDKSNEILKYVEGLKFDEISKFKLIENDYPSVDVFIELDEDAKEIWIKYQKLFEIKNLFERKNEFLSFKASFYEYVISISKGYAVGLEDEKIDHISFDKLELYYDLDTGFKIENAGTGTMIL